MVCRCFSFSKEVFSGSMFVFRGVFQNGFKDASFNWWKTITNSYMVPWWHPKPNKNTSSRYASIVRHLTPLTILHATTLKSKRRQVALGDESKCYKCCELMGRDPTPGNTLNIPFFNGVYVYDITGGAGFLPSRVWVDWKINLETFLAKLRLFVDDLVFS